MTLELRKFQLIELLVSLRDESVISKVENLLREERIKTYEASLKPMSVQELQKRALASEEDIKAGRLIDIEDLQKEMENW